MLNKKISVWFMRQAGRYLEEYKNISKNFSFFEMCNDSEIASTITMQPIQRFKSIDAAIIFSDILVLPKALGVKLDILKNTGPTISKIKSVKDLNFNNFDKIIAPTLNAIKLTRKKLSQEKTLIGFAGAPWTIAAYIIEGSWNKTFVDVKQFFYQRRAEFEEIINIITDATILYLNKQIECGADIVQIFDSFANALPSHEFSKWIIEPTKRIVKEVNSKVIGFPKGAGTNYVDYASETKVDAVGVDYCVSPKWIKENLQPICKVQGNLDPFLLCFNVDMAIEETKNIINELGEKSFIFNLGHGMYKETPIANVEAILAEIERFR